MRIGSRLSSFIHSGFAFRPPCTETRVARYLSTSAARTAAAPEAAGHAGAPVFFIPEKFNTEPCTPRSARFPRYTSKKLDESAMHYEHRQQAPRGCGAIRPGGQVLMS